MAVPWLLLGIEDNCGSYITIEQKYRYFVY